MGLQNDKVTRMLDDEIWSDDETATTAASTAEPMEDEFDSDEDDEVTDIQDENRYRDPLNIALYNGEGRYTSRSSGKRRRRNDDGMSSTKRRRQLRKPSNEEAKPSQHEAKPSPKEAKSTSPKGVAPSSEKVHAENLDGIKLAAERCLDVECNAERSPTKIECKSKDLPAQRGGEMGP